MGTWSGYDKFTLDTWSERVIKGGLGQACRCPSGKWTQGPQNCHVGAQPWPISLDTSPVRSQCIALLDVPTLQEVYATDVVLLNLQHDLLV